MKLYATTTSERASKGQGGNEYLEINVLVEYNKIRLGFGSINVIDDTERERFLLYYSTDKGHSEIDAISYKELKSQKVKSQLDCGCEKDVFVCRKHSK